MIKISNLSIKIGDKILVDNLSFALESGQALGIVGESGSGKTLACSAISGLMPWFGNWRIGGTMEFMGQKTEIADAPSRQHHAGKDIGFIFQDSLTTLNPLHHIAKQLAEAFIGDFDKATLNLMVKTALSEVGLPNDDEFLMRLPHQLSGGQRQRVIIAIALANKPSLVVADEPLTALDAHLKRQILELIKQKTANSCLIYISHELNSVRHLCHQVIVMQQGAIREFGKTSDIFTNPRHEYTKELLRIPPIKTDKNAQNTPIILQVKDLAVQYPIKKGILQRISHYHQIIKPCAWQLHQGQILGIIGASGSGKSTMAHALLRLIASSGMMKFNDIAYQNFNHQQFLPYRKEMQILFQDPYSSLSPRMNIGQICQEPLDFHFVKLSEAEKQAKIAAQLIAVGLNPEDCTKYPHEFSGGQRQRIALARALIMQPKLLILDEPTSALDKSTGQKIIDLILEISQKSGLSCIVISHDFYVIMQLCDNVVVMNNGDVIEENTPQNLLKNPQHQYTKDLIYAANYQ